ncbi:putative receptor protein kinase CRINKLY4 [Asimina triloba]
MEESTCGLRTCFADISSIAEMGIIYLEDHREWRRTLFDIVAKVYANVDLRLWLPASSNVRLHLNFLAYQDKLPKDSMNSTMIAWMLISANHRIQNLLALHCSYTTTKYNRQLLSLQMPIFFAEIIQPCPFAEINILIDEKHNARVADFGLSLLGPADSSSPLSELPAGTFGYLDPDFSVLLLDSLSGRKALDMQYEEGIIVERAVPLIKAGDISAILDPVLKPPADLVALKRISVVACKCVSMWGKARPSIDRVTPALEHALAYLLGSLCNETPFLPTEVVLGSSRLHKIPSQVSSNLSSEMETVEAEDLRCGFRAPSWITFPSVVSSQRRKSSVSEADVDARITDGRNAGGVSAGGDGL